MATALVTGILRDFRLAPMASLSPKITFTPEGWSTTPGRLLASHPITVVPISDGVFEVELQTTDDIAPKRGYRIAIEWLDAAGNFIRVDYVDEILYVPEGGGLIGDLLRSPANSALTWVSLTPPPNPSPGVWWLEQNPTDYDDPANTGWLYEWSA